MPLTRRGRRVLVALGAFAAVGSGIGYGVNALREAAVAPPMPGCTATVDGHQVELDPEQSQNASIIAAVGVRRAMPARAVSIALATAMQESKLRNVDGGDRDSAGLFQQRPSQGWGTPAQVRDPVHAANAFYAALAKVPNYTSLPITEAAQLVQRSGFPDAYAWHEGDARALASSLTGYSPGTFSCIVSSPRLHRQPLGPDGLTARADAVRAALAAAYGSLPLGGFAPGGVSAGHGTHSAHYEGRAIDVFFRPVTPDNQRMGWAVAQWAVANAQQLHIATVIFDDKIWSAQHDSEGWRHYQAPDAPGNPATLRHLDHVHIDVLRGS